jgi:transposase
MEKKVFIGIDFSKEKFEVTVLAETGMKRLGHETFENERSGCKAMMAWIRKLTKVSSKEWMFCGEHTGLYSVTLATFIMLKGLFFWLENPLQIKQSGGLRRGKSDSADSLMIAEYAYRNRDKAKAYRLPEKEILRLDLLMKYRSRLVTGKVRLKVSADECRKEYKRDTAMRLIYEDTMTHVNRFDKSIEKCEKEILDIIKSNESLKENYEIVTSLKGIGLVNAVAIIVATRNFTEFENSRRFACYAGLAPFSKESGTSIHTGRHVSHLADKSIKSLLTQAARAAVMHNPKMRSYYERKIKEGKHDKLVINNVKAKMVHCIFAMIKNRRKYDEDYDNPLKREVQNMMQAKNSSQKVWPET